jgi:dTDP-4-dehydrorhamnose 3,5-epimerase
MLNGVILLESKPIADERGYFERLFCLREFQALGLDKEIINVNHSKTELKGTIRGMHFQKSPASEVKILKCVRGSIFDVVIDIRRDSPTYLKHFSVELNEKNNLMLYVPEGFAHGFQSLSKDTEIIYFVTNYYSNELESNLNPFDPSIGIDWPLECSNISDKDKNANFIGNHFIGA